MRKILEIIVHCTATFPEQRVTVADITRWHKQRGWKTIGYHYVVDQDGNVFPGRPLEQAGAHCLDHNKNSIGVVYCGGLNAEGKPARKGRITIHQPRINKEERSGSNVLQQTNVADSTRSNSQTHTSTNDSKEVIGGAEPPNLTAVFIVLGLGIMLLLIGAVFGYLWLHKKHII